MTPSIYSLSFPEMVLIWEMVGKTVVHKAGFLIFTGVKILSFMDD